MTKKSAQTQELQKCLPVPSVLEYAHLRIANDLWEPWLFWFDATNSFTFNLTSLI